jgi:hypothetical protein
VLQETQIETLQATPVKQIAMMKVLIKHLLLLNKEQNEQLLKVMALGHMAKVDIGVLKGNCTLKIEDSRDEIDPPRNAALHKHIKGYKQDKLVSEKRVQIALFYSKLLQLCYPNLETLVADQIAVYKRKLVTKSFFQYLSKDVLRPLPIHVDLKALLSFNNL